MVELEAGAGSAGRKPRRAWLVLGFGLGIAAMVSIAIWLTFVRTNSSSSMSAMTGGEMGPSVCSLLPTSTIEQATGKIWVERGTSTRATVTTCSYQVAGRPSSFLDGSFEMQVDARGVARRAAALASSYPSIGASRAATVTSVAGLGDQALLVRTPTGASALFVRRGSDGLLLVSSERARPVEAVARQLVGSL
jgi:hypothetical protein